MTTDNGSTTNITNEQIRAGQAVYTKSALKLYDAVVLGVSNWLIWQCPTQRIVALYNERITDNNLDVGVGTGYFLDRCPFRHRYRASS